MLTSRIKLKHYTVFSSCTALLDVSYSGTLQISYIDWLIVEIRSCSNKLVLFAVLVFDVLVVALTKATVRRQRPAENAPDMMTVSVDKYSFPSGHASRAFMIAMFLVIHFHISVTWTCIVWLWAVSVAMSRILLGRHHVSDVMAGTFLGCIECSIVNCCNLWLSADLCSYIIRPLQEELHL